jgi:hypothetical protein
LGALVLIGFIPLALLEATWSGKRGGHLPWPAVQWAVTTPLGTLVVIFLGLLVLAPPTVLLSVSQRRRELARAVDVTSLPPWAWPGPWQRRPRHLSLHGWLGEGRREQALSLALLALGVPLAVALVGIFVASGIYGLAAHGSLQCGDVGTACPPTFALTGDVLASQFAAMALAYVARSLWLRRVEVASHLLLRYQDWSWMSPLCYIRSIDLNPDAAATSLARFSTSVTTPFARRFFIGAVVSTPYVMLVSTSFVLSTWLQLQWRPG